MPDDRTSGTVGNFTSPHKDDCITLSSGSDDGYEEVSKNTAEDPNPGTRFVW